MRDEAEMSVLRRMVGADRPGPALSAMTPEKAMRLAVARAGDEALACVVGLRGLQETRGIPDALIGSFPDPVLVIQLDGPGRQRGLALMCPQVVAAVIEAQTMGRVTAASAAERAPTRTDAILVTEFLDLLLAGVVALGSTGADPPLLAGYVWAGSLPDVRAGTMVLEEAEHQHYAVEIDFAKGAKTGFLHLVVPVAGPEEKRTDARPAWTEKLGHAVLGSAARLEAILCRQKMPLAVISGFAVGDVVRLDTASLDRVSLTGTNGNILMMAALGRSGAMRALRLELQAERAEAPAAPRQIEEPL